VRSYVNSQILFAAANSARVYFEQIGPLDRAKTGDTGHNHRVQIHENFLLLAWNPVRNF
jgi:hypothetical protein